MATDHDKLIEMAHKLPLSASLPRILRFAESINDTSLATWVRLELLGYAGSNPVMTEQTIVPEYRTVGGQWYDAYARLLVLEDPALSFVNETRLRSGVTELEILVGANGVIAIQLPDLSQILREHLGVEVTTFRFSPKAIPQVLASIKAQMLDRLATLRDFPETPGLSRAAAARDEILELRPNLYGIGINLKALWRRWRS